MRVLSCILPLTLAAMATSATSAQSNFDPEYSVIEVETIGAVNWLPSIEHGAVINQFYASGYIYGANIGWVHLGSMPSDSFQYRNNRATDFGVNVGLTGELRGFAYGANVGWLSFESIGNPRVNWISGELSGRIWAANLGWIELENAGQTLRIESLATPPDSDGDDIPDAWEMRHASNLTTFRRGLDADADGQLDADEYLAGTNPLDVNDFLSLDLFFAGDSAEPALRWPTKSNYIYFMDERESLSASATWQPTSTEPVIGSGANASLAVTPGAAFNFYRIRAYPPLSAPTL